MCIVHCSMFRYLVHARALFTLTNSRSAGVYSVSKITHAHMDTARALFTRNRTASMTDDRNRMCATAVLNFKFQMFNAIARSPYRTRLLLPMLSLAHSKLATVCEQTNAQLEMTTPRPRLKINPNNFQCEMLVNGKCALPSASVAFQSSVLIHATTVTYFIHLPNQTY